MANDLPQFYEDEYPGWAQFCESVHKMKTFTEENGIKVAFALIPIPEGYDNYPYHAYHERLTSVLNGMHKFPVYDLIEAVRSLDARKHWVHPSDGHPDTFVHKEMGEYLEQIVPWAKWMDKE